MKRYFLIVCSAHFIFFMMLAFVFTYRETMQKEQFLPAYIAPFIQDRVVKSLSKEIQTEKRGIQKKESAASVAIHPLSEETHDELLKRLHDKIASQQHYPESALELNQSGTTQVGLVLAPDGAISDISILKSSGYESLDRAALAAVGASSPLLEVKGLLTSATFFSVSIFFQIE